MVLKKRKKKMMREFWRFLELIDSMNERETPLVHVVFQVDGRRWSEMGRVSMIRFGFCPFGL